MGKTTFAGNLGLLHLGILLILVNLAVIYFFDIEVSRAIRLGSCITLIGYLLVKSGFKKNLLVLGLSFLLVRDIAVLFYEIPVFKTASLLCTVLVYTGICLFTFKRLPMVRFSRTIIIFGLVIIVLNIFNVFYLSDIIIASLDNDAQLILFFTQSAVMLFMALFAFLYNESFEGTQSLHLLLCVLAFIFSDLGGLAAYFFGYEPAFYAERTFYLIAASYLVHYTINFQPEADVISELSDSGLKV
tara:strand:- start:56676 stop:57407 length:732 start_codon:yes stop_codon:yes gene_type:complete